MFVGLKGVFGYLRVAFLIFLFEYHAEIGVVRFIDGLAELFVGLVVFREGTVWEEFSWFLFLQSLWDMNLLRATENALGKTWETWFLFIWCFKGSLFLFAFLTWFLLFALHALLFTFHTFLFAFVALEWLTLHALFLLSTFDTFLFTSDTLLFISQRFFPAGHTLTGHSLARHSFAGFHIVNNSLLLRLRQRRPFRTLSKMLNLSIMWWSNLIKMCRRFTGSMLTRLFWLFTDINYRSFFKSRLFFEFIIIIGHKWLFFWVCVGIFIHKRWFFVLLLVAFDFIIIVENKLCGLIFRLSHLIFL